MTTRQWIFFSNRGLIEFSMIMMKCGNEIDFGSMRIDIFVFKYSVIFQALLNPLQSLWHLFLLPALHLN